MRRTKWQWFRPSVGKRRVAEALPNAEEEVSTECLHHAPYLACIFLSSRGPVQRGQTAARNKVSTTHSKVSVRARHATPDVIPALPPSASPMGAAATARALEPHRASGPPPCKQAAPAARP